MNDKFDELTKQMAQSVTRRAAFKKFGVGLAGMALACFGLTDKARAARPQRAYCKITRLGWFGKPFYTGTCMDINRCVSVASADCPAYGTVVGDTYAGGSGACLPQAYDSAKPCSFTT